jgi:hypothetical protein
MTFTFGFVGPAVAAGELPSTPVRVDEPADAAPTATVSVSAETSKMSPATVQIGVNVLGSRRNNSFFIPPDTMGAVGPDHIVEILNGVYAVYDKTDGSLVSRTSLDGFWVTTVGLTIPQNNTCSMGTCTRSGDDCTVDPCPNNFTFDPRIVYDIATDRWIATSIDAWSGNNFYVARSDTDDPTGDWDGVRFAADTVGVAEFHDYDTLGLDADGVFICTQDFNGGGNESCYSIPKADILAATPTVANMTRFEATPAGLPAVSGAWQAAVDFGTSDSRSAMLASTGSALVRTDVLNADTATATLGTSRAITGDPGHAPAPGARQPHPSGRTIENVNPRFVSNVFEQGDSLWAVHAVQGTSGSSAVRWYEIDETTDTVIQTGLIEDANEDYHEPSIAVNEYGKVIVGYTCSGPSLNPSSCVSIGETSGGGTTTFEPRMVLQLGDGYYYRESAPGRNRWGDYSATVLDPDDSCTFWTFQEFVETSATGNPGPDTCSTTSTTFCSQNSDCPAGETCVLRPESGEWGIQITQLRFTTDECNRPPVCDANGPYSAECDGPTTTLTLDATGSSDPDEDALAYSWTTDCPGGAFDDSTSAAPELTLDTGGTCDFSCNVTLTVTDEHGLSDSCGSTVTVTDTTSPTPTCPADVVVECDQPTAPSATGFATATDVCDPSPQTAYGDVETPGACPQEKTITRTWTATDVCFNDDSCDQTVEVVDTTPPVPECNAPPTITPPDAPVAFVTTAIDNCDDVPSSIVTGFDCFAINGSGKKISKLESCIVSFEGSEVTIHDSGGVGTTISWDVLATDACGNSQAATCQVDVVNPGQS